MDNSGFCLIRHFYDLGRCGHYIPIPDSNPSYMRARQTGTAIDVVGIPVACPECGLVSMYSPQHIHLSHSSTGCPYREGKLDLVYVPLGCADSNCEPPTNILAVWDVSTKSFRGSRPPSTWLLDETVRCEHGHRLPNPVRDPDRCPVVTKNFPF